MDNLNSFLEPGMIVEHPKAPEWGLGQVQSNINGRVTVNFENVGKQVINSQDVALRRWFGPASGDAGL